MREQRVIKERLHISPTDAFERGVFLNANLDEAGAVIQAHDANGKIVTLRYADSKSLRLLADIAARFARRLEEHEHAQTIAGAVASSAQKSEDGSLAAVPAETPHVNGEVTT